jgi:hypothetical protein
MTDYPEYFLRGLSADDWVCDGIVTAAAFQIKLEPKFMKGEYSAQSISWEDDSTVVDLMMNQKNTDKDGNDKIQFRVGLARYPRESIDRIMKSPAYRGIISYERDPLKDNKYHGNLLISSKLSNTQKKMLPGVIASEFTDIILRDRYRGKANG